tara:strand:- start:92 stop:463 length:372 start_codon:yes stop_codon:yes gene_type:complete
MVSYEDLVGGLMGTSQTAREEEDLKLTYKKLYPLMLEDFAHREDIELFVEAITNNVMNQLAGFSPLLKGLGKVRSGRTGLGDKIGRNLVIKKNSKLADGSTTPSAVRKDLDLSPTFSKIKSTF